jgi:hypothetical protein
MAKPIVGKKTKIHIYAYGGKTLCGKDTQGLKVLHSTHYQGTRTVTCKVCHGALKKSIDWGKGARKGAR